VQQHNPGEVEFFLTVHSTFPKEYHVEFSSNRFMFARVVMSGVLFFSDLQCTSHIIIKYTFDLQCESKITPCDLRFSDIFSQTVKNFKSVFYTPIIRSYLR